MEKGLKKIMGELAEIGQLISQMEGGEPIPRIETDIIREKIRRLYENVRLLETGQYETRLAAKPERAKPEAPKTEAPVREKILETPTQSTTRKKKPEILADKYKSEKNYINEALSHKNGKQDVSSRLQSKPIKQISSSLGINDRFKLINELFNGDKDSYQKAIGILDDAQNFNEAFTYINSTFEWDMEDESVQMLLDLVRRKFIVNQDE